MGRHRPNPPIYFISPSQPNQVYKAIGGTLLIQLLSLLDDFLFVLRITLDRGILLGLITKVCNCYLHFAGRRRPAQSKIRIVKHLNSQINALGPEINNQCISLKVAAFIGVKLDAWLASIYLFGYDAAPGEYIADFLGSYVLG